MAITWSNGTTTATGLVLADREMNGYDDSDFYAVVWNAEKSEPVQLIYASTRFGGGGRCEIDATDDVRTAYAEWQDAQVKAKRAEHEAWLDSEAERAGLTRQQFDDLLTVYGDDGSLMLALTDLLDSEHGNRLRSEFRKSLAAQVRAWLESDEREYKTPLSFRQAGFVMPRRPSWSKPEAPMYRRRFFAPLYAR